MTTVDQLESVAQQLAARIRDDSPEDVARWLTIMLPEPSDWFRLCFMLAAAVPDDRSWSQLVGWADRRETRSPIRYRPSTPEEQELRRRALDQAMRPGKAA